MIRFPPIFLGKSVAIAVGTPGPMPPPFRNTVVNVSLNVECPVA